MKPAKVSNDRGLVIGTHLDRMRNSRLATVAKRWNIFRTASILLGTRWIPSPVIANDRYPPVYPERYPQPAKKRPRGQPRWGPPSPCEKTNRSRKRDREKTGQRERRDARRRERRDGIQNAVISERVKKCGRIKAPFAPGGPETGLRTFSVASREGDEAAEGPAVIGSAYL